MTALFFVFLFGPTVIRSLRVRQGKGQPIRNDGPERHLIEKGHAHHGRPDDLVRRPVSVLLWADLSNLYVWVVLLVTLPSGCSGSRTTI